MSTPDTALVLKVEEVAELLRVGRTTVYALISTGELGSVKVAGLRRIPVKCLNDYMNRLLAAA